MDKQSYFYLSSLSLGIAMVPIYFFLFQTPHWIFFVEHRISTTKILLHSILFKVHSSLRSNCLNFKYERYLFFCFLQDYNTPVPRGNTLMITRWTFRNPQGQIFCRWIVYHTLKMCLPGAVIPSRYTTQYQYELDTNLIP